MKLVLASTSPRRKEILSKSGFQFEVEAGDFEEDMTLALDPASLAKYLSHGKAESVARKRKDAVVIGADTFIVFENKVLGKPHTAERAFKMLTLLSGKTHSVITGVTIIDTAREKVASIAEETKVYFRPLSDEEVNAYIETGEPLDRAGSYAIQGGAAGFVQKIEGDYHNVMGLPLDRVVRILKEEFDISE